MGEEKNKQNKVAIRYKNSPNYQTYTADGTFGGLTPEGKLIMDFYVEKQDSPEFIVHEVEDDGKIGDLIEQKGFKGITREKQFGLVLTLRRVYELREWLDRKLEEAESKGLIEINE